MKGVNIPIMIASLVLSILLWMVVYAQNVTMTPMLYAVKLNQEGLDTDQHIVTKMDELFRFTAAGPEDRIGRIKSESLAAYVDLREAMVGTHEYPVKVIPEEIEEFVTNKDLTTRVTIEPVEQKTVPVKVEGQGQLQDPRYRLTETALEPPEVIVRGAKSQVDRASRARIRLDLSTLNTEMSRGYTMAVEVVDADGRPLEKDLIRTEPMFVRVTPVLNVAPEEKTVFVSPVFRGELSRGYVSEGAILTPKQVTIVGPGLALAAITKVQTEPIDISGLTRTTTRRVKLVVPSGIIVRGSDTVEVRVEVSEPKVPETPAAPEEAGRTDQ